MGAACDDCRTNKVRCEHPKNYFSSLGTTYSLVEDEMGVQRWMPIMKG